MSPRILIAMLLAAFCVTGTQAAQVEFNYNGRVRVHGQDFTGNGLFKFMLLSADGTQSYWANDGAAVTGEEPAVSVVSPVERGFFSVNIGDDALNGMAPINPAVFNTGDRVRLRVWFSDGQKGFQRLTPDSEVTNPALLGLQSRDLLELYVNADTGNDAWAGTRISRPKRTIQSAWDALPTLIQSTATIHIADGVYYGHVQLNGKFAAGNARIRLVGNETTPSLVMLLGRPYAGSTQTLPTIMTVRSQQALELVGLTFAHAITGITSQERASFMLDHCIVTSHTWAMANNASDVTVKSTEMGICDTVFIATNASRVTMRDSYIHDSYAGFMHHGLAIWGNSTLDLGTTLIERCGNGIHTQYGSFVSLGGGGNRIRNCETGITGRVNATVFGSSPQYGYVTYSGNVTNTSFILGTQIDQ